MHHRGGAYSETQYIYGDAVRLALQNGLHRFVSVGLGLGYNELLIACESLRHGLQPTDVWLMSYETEDQLKTDFLNFVLQRPEVPKVYHQLLQFFLKDYTFDAREILQWLRSAYECGGWILGAGLQLQSPVLQKANCCLFDAFSSKTTPDLWTEEFLCVFMQDHLDEKAIFSTYARTGNLKRALLARGFQMTKRPGFAGRRESTLALRGIQPIQSGS